MISIILRAFLFVLLTISSVNAEDIYITQTASGTDSGASCNDAHSATWLNTGSNWANPKVTGKIGPDDIVHLCGTFTLPAATVFLDVPGSGSLGHPIMIKWEDDAVVEAPYFPSGNSIHTAGAICVSGFNYITLDGGTNGIMRCTDNGDLLTYRHASTAIFVAGDDTLEIKNLNFKNLYVRAPGTCAEFPAVYPADGADLATNAIYIYGYAPRNIFIHDNTVDWVGSAFSGNYDGTQLYGSYSHNWQVYNNTVTHCGTAVAIGDGNVNCMLSGLYIHDNDFDGAGDWWDYHDDFHLNHIHIWSTHTGSILSDVQIYNNKNHGDFGTGRCDPTLQWTPHQTSSIYVEGNAGQITGLQVFNNLILEPSVYDFCGGLISISYVDNPYVANNTIISGSTQGYSISIYASTGTVSKNNIVIGGDVYMKFFISTMATGGIDYNLYYNSGGRLFQTAYSGDGSSYTLETWQAAGYDLHSVIADPLLDSGYVPTLTSPARGTAADLSSIFDFDITNSLRPPGSWSRGAYEFIPPPPPPFTGVSGGGMLNGKM